MSPKQSVPFLFHVNHIKLLMALTIVHAFFYLVRRRMGKEKVIGSGFGLGLANE